MQARTPINKNPANDTPHYSEKKGASMKPQINEVARRIHSLRDDMGFSREEMAEAIGVSIEDYISAEETPTDYSFTFLYRAAEKLGVDMIDLLTGENPHLSGYSLMRAGDGLSIKRRAGFEYLHLAPNFKNKLAEPFMVTAPYLEEQQDLPISLSQHAGQELNFIVSGRMRFAFDNHLEDLSPGDTLLYDSTHPHGMIAIGGEPCTFLAIVLKSTDAESKAPHAKS